MTAVGYLVLSLVISAVSSVVYYSAVRERTQAELVSNLVTYALLAFLTYKIWRGRNWARITMLVLVALGLALYYWSLKMLYAVSPAAAWINLAGSVLQLLGLGMLFSGPARSWYART